MCVLPVFLPPALGEEEEEEEEEGFKEQVHAFPFHLMCSLKCSVRSFNQLAPWVSRVAGME